MDKYKRKTKDFSQSIEDHEKEFDLLEQEIINSNPPKYIIESRSIIDKFSNIATQIFEVYSKQCSSVLDDSKLQSYIESELARISLIFFANLSGVKVIISEGDDHHKSNIKKSSLLYEKYQENYISDLIDPAKSAVRLFLYNY
jgi:sugar-specific transcriptional regulator TrmB